MLENSMREVVNELSKQTEELLLEQLGFLVSRGLLVIERGPMSIVEGFQPRLGPTPTKLELRQQVSIKLKDQEYIERLEKENEELRDLITRLKCVLT